MSHSSDITNAAAARITTLTLPDDSDPETVATVNAPFLASARYARWIELQLRQSAVQNLAPVLTTTSGLFDAATVAVDLVWNNVANAWYGVTSKAEFMTAPDGADRLSGGVITDAQVGDVSLMATYQDDGASAGLSAWGGVKDIGGAVLRPGVFRRNIAGTFGFADFAGFSGTGPTSFGSGTLTGVGGVVRNALISSSAAGIWVAYIDSRANDTSGSVGIATASATATSWTWRLISGTHAGDYTIGNRPNLFLACPTTHAAATQIVAASTKTSASCIISANQGTTWATESFGWTGGSPVVAGLCWSDDGYFYAVASVTGSVSELRRKLPTDTSWTLVTMTFDGSSVPILTDLRALDGGILVAKTASGWVSSNGDQGRLWFSVDGGSTWHRSGVGTAKGSGILTLGSSDSGRMALCGPQIVLLPPMFGYQKRGQQ